MDTTKVEIAAMRAEIVAILMGLALGSAT